MNNETARNIRLGLFVIAGVILLITGLYLIGSNRNLFSSTVTLYATFKNVNGLQHGNNVRYSGIDVGTVKKIEIVSDTAIKIKMLIKADLKRVIRKNAIVSLGTDGLMGSRIINIEPTTPNAPLVNENDELATIGGINMEEMLRTLAVTNKNVMDISHNLKTLTDNLNSSRGTLYTVLMDTTVGPQVHKALKNIVVISDNIKTASGDLNNAMADIENGNGLLGTLLKDSVVANDLVQAVSEVKTAGEQINVSAGELRQILLKANQGGGTISTLINDTASANSLKRSLVNIEISAFKFSQNMEALKHNFLFRPYFKKQEKQKKQ